jgi:hypothetical protein
MALDRRMNLVLRPWAELDGDQLLGSRSKSAAYQLRKSVRVEATSGTRHQQPIVVDRTTCPRTIEQLAILSAG